MRTLKIVKYLAFEGFPLKFLLTFVFCFFFQLISSKFSFFPPQKDQKSSGFLITETGIEMEYWPEMG